MSRKKRQRDKSPDAPPAAATDIPVNPGPPSGGHLPGENWSIPPLYWLLAAAPLAIGLKMSGASGVWVFLASCVAVIPLAGLMGEATEHLAEKMGPGIGGLLNATFGNAAELIIALMALRAGPENYDLVKASITGSIIGNLLLVLGASIVAGGLFHKRQLFNATAASMGSTLLALACVGLVVPSLFFWLAHSPAPETAAQKNIDLISEEIAFVLAVTYVLSLVFSLRTHTHLFAGEEEEATGGAADGHAGWSRGKSVWVLVAATIGVALMSELLVGSVEEAAKSMGMSHVFVGVIVVAVIGNAAEHSTAIMVAVKNKMDLAVNIAIGSSLQIALFVAPALVFASMLMGHSHPLDLHFTVMEVAALLAAVFVTSQVCNDGETHWMEGVMLLAVYVILGLAFYHLPPDAVGKSH